MKGCPEGVTVTGADREIEREIKMHGGSLTAEEYAHSRLFRKRGMAWSRVNGERMIRNLRMVNAHAHDDGSVWVTR